MTERNQDLTLRVARLEYLLASSTRENRDLRRWLVRIGAAASACVAGLPFAALAVTLPTGVPGSGTPIMASDVWDNFETLASAVTTLEAVRISANDDALACDDLVDPCTSTNLVTPALATDGNVVLRVELYGGEEGSQDGSFVQLNGGGDPDSTAALSFERRTDGGAWQPIAAHRFRDAPSVLPGQIAIPCSSFASFDTPPAGEHEYRLSVTVGDASGDVVVQNCRVAVAVAGRVR